MLQKPVDCSTSNWIGWPSELLVSADIVPDSIMNKFQNYLVGGGGTIELHCASGSYSRDRMNRSPTYGIIFPGKLSPDFPRVVRSSTVRLRSSNSCGFFRHPNYSHRRTTLLEPNGPRFLAPPRSGERLAVFGVIHRFKEISESSACMSVPGKLGS